MRPIDADVLISELNNSHFPGAPYVDAGISIAIGKVCDAPTIEAESVRRGKWIKKKNIMLGDYFECSLCNDAESRIAPGWWDAKNFCPHCGSKMDGEQHE